MPRAQQWTVQAGLPSLASGRAGVKASSSHVRAPCDRATHPTRSLSLLLVCLCLSPCWFCHQARDWLACGHHGEEKLGKQVGRTELKPQVPSLPPCQASTQALAPAACPEATQPPRQVLDMEELTIWEQHTATISKDPRRGFGIAISGGRDRPSGSVVVSDVVPGGPAEGRLQTGDHIVMVNGVSVENVTSSFAIQILKTCTKVANIINGVSSENLSLSDTRQLIEKSEGKLTLLVLRDRSQFLVNIPPVVSDSDSSLLEDISDLGSELSQAPPSHIPPPPRHGQRSPDGSRTNSPVYVWCLDRSVCLGKTGSSLSDSPRQRSYDIYRVPSRQSMEDHGYSPDLRVVHFIKGTNIGLRLAGGNDVGIFVSGVQAGSPADGQGIQEGDEILQVNDMLFQNLTREEAVQFLMGLPQGEEVELVTQRKQDIFRKMVQSRLGDSFYIRTHFEMEPSPPSGLGFTRGDVFHVLDTLYPSPGQSHARGGHWLAVRMGRDLREKERGIIPNQSRAEQLASLEAAQRAVGAGPGASTGSSTRAEFWRLRGLRRGAKKTTQRSREDLSALTKQGHYPPYERVVLREASFKRPVVILGPVADIAMQKLTAEMPDEFEIAESVLRTDSPSKIIKLDTVRVIAEKDKHALLDVTPSAIERLNYVQYYPIVVFCVPESRTALKALRQWLAPASRRSSRRLYAQAQKLRKHSDHLFTATIPLQGTSDSWYQELKAIIREQQTRPIWTAEDQLDSSSEDNLDLPHRDLADSSADLSCDSRVNSDYETDGEGYTDGEGGPYTDVDEEPPAPALARSSEPVLADEPQILQDHGRPSGHQAPQVDGRHPQGQWRQDSMRTYGQDALRKKFTRARDVESSDDDSYNWGPATDL
uniref:Tight junction protein ZO-3 n=1 Tax=Sus scrofa TaxID=9823 RepID=A0A8D0ND92_PIG